MGDLRYGGPTPATPGGLAPKSYVDAGLAGKQPAGSYAPAAGIAPTAITGTAVVTADSRLADARRGIFTDRGNWAASTAYAYGDVVTNGQQRWLNKAPHTSVATFSGTANWILLSTPEAVAALPLNAPWTNYGAGFQTARYEQAGNDVRITGTLVNNGSTPSGSVIATLPIGARPALIQRGIVDTGAVTSMMQLSINTDGTITAGAALGFTNVSLCGVSFSIL